MIRKYIKKISNKYFSLMESQSPITQYYFGEHQFFLPKESNDVAITFDDGPHPIYTIEILKILKEFNVKATFFMIGKNVKKYPHIARRVLDEGHELGNHGYNHIRLGVCPKETVKQELDDTSLAIKLATGVKVTLFRPPYGNRNKHVLTIARQSGLKTVMWSTNSNDWKLSGIDNILYEVKRKIKTGSIVLFHDGSESDESIDRTQTVASLRLLIPCIKRKGLNVRTVSTS